MFWLQYFLKNLLPLGDFLPLRPLPQPSSASCLLTLPARCIAGILLLISSSAASYAQEVAGRPFTQLFSLQLSPLDSIIIVVATAAAMMVASYEFARGKVTVLDVPTMPKYTVTRSTYRYFNFLYAVIVLVLFAITMEHYETLRQLLKKQFDAFGMLPDGKNILTISIGSVVMVVALHYLKLPNSQIGPSWFLYRLRRLLHKRARIPDEAQALAKQFLSDDAGVFEIPASQVSALVNRPEVQSVTVADLGAARNTIDYQWAVVSYLYMIGLRYDTERPTSSFVSNDASRWSDIKNDYKNLLPSILRVKDGQGGDEFERVTRESVSKLRLNLSIFHACLHLFTVNSDVGRAKKLKNIGLKRKAVFFVVGRTFIAKFLVFVISGIAVPPLAFGGYAIFTGSEMFKNLADPWVIIMWVEVGAPMYVLPFVMVILLKRIMTTSWSIRATRESVKNDSSIRHSSEFKFDIYLLIFILSLGIASVPIIAYNSIHHPTPPIELFWVLSPAATAVALAILIDVDVVDHGTINVSERPRYWVLAIRAIGFAVLVSGIVSWLTYTLFDQSPATLVVYATTAAFMGIMIGVGADFHRLVKVV